SGRAEYRNKGLDLFLDAAATLQRIQPGRQTIAFVMVPAWCVGPRADLRQALTETNHTQALPEPVITHCLGNMDYDPVLGRIRGLGISNSAQSDVDVIFVPCYLNGMDGVFTLSYYQLLIGMDATVFPSYYEPWGYTPLESVAFGVPTITTSLSGFGQWVESNFENDFSASGVFVADRTDTNYWEVVDGISRSLKFLSSADRSTTDKISKSAFHTAAQANWSYFIDYYIKAYDIALTNEEKRNADTDK
ncbi:MAG: glycosyltransferase, partial [Paramuribaculum sp.]|nr:glycosyltransferase [Paramuribaculum sp.]